MFRHFSRKSLLLAGWSLLAAAPVLFVLWQVVAASRNIIFWDEFDTALDLVLQIDGGVGAQELLHRFFAIANEHRTVTSRLIFAASYWLTGALNFHAIGAIGNLFFLGACATLVWAMNGWERRLRMGVVLAFMMFQLEHFESFIWSGASIDHFQVVLHAVLAIAFLNRATVKATALALCFGLLATFTLAQGNVVWAVGALMLARGCRWRELVVWITVAVAVVGAFLHGFELNPGHAIHEPTAANLMHVARYWLTLLGAPLTLGEAEWAPPIGLALIAAYVYLGIRDMPRRQAVAWFSGVFGIGALSLVALGRAELAGSMVNSRYLVLGALAWSMLVFMLLELGADANPARPFRHLSWVLPGLAAFAFAADWKFAPMIGSFVEVRDRAATAFETYGADGRDVSQVRLHPRDHHADVLLKKAEDRGIYRLPVFARPATFASTKTSTRLIAYVDELVANDRAVAIGGWAMLPKRTSHRDEVYVVLRSARTELIFSAITLQRSDVAAAYKEPRWSDCGFRSVIRRERLPKEDFTIGVLLAHDGERELLMTGNRIDLSGAEPRIFRPPAVP